MFMSIAAAASFAAHMTDGIPRTQRTRMELHYHLVSLLLRAGPDGMPISLLAQTLYPGLARRRAVSCTRSLVSVAEAALPMRISPEGGVVSLDVDDWAECLAYKYQIPVGGA